MNGILFSIGHNVSGLVAVRIINPQNIIKMDKAKQILEEALSYKNCDGLIEENSRLEDAVLYAINEALQQAHVMRSLPSDDDIAKWVKEHGYYGHCTQEYHEGLEEGAKWVKRLSEGNGA